VVENYAPKEHWFLSFLGGRNVTPVVICGFIIVHEILGLSHASIRISWDELQDRKNFTTCLQGSRGVKNLTKTTVIMPGERDFVDMHT